MGRRPEGSQHPAEPTAGSRLKIGSSWKAAFTFEKDTATQQRYPRTESGKETRVMLSIAAKAASCAPVSRRSPGDT